jgi:hypothetical protein
MRCLSHEIAPLALHVVVAEGPNEIALRERAALRT